MSIDDPIAAIQRRFEDEERASDPVLSRLARLASQLPLPWPSDKVMGVVTGRLAANRFERIECLLTAIIDELRRHERQLREMAATQNEEMQKRFQEWFALVEDGFQKAERTRAKERVRRIGIILANSLVKTPILRPDDTEEMMRVAAELSDAEIQSLNDLVKIQGTIVENSGRIDRYSAWSSWASGPWGLRPDSLIDSTFRKLESFGLVSQVPPQSNQNVTADIPNRYSLLKKGLDFTRFIQQNEKAGPLM